MDKTIIPGKVKNICDAPCEILTAVFVFCAQYTGQCLLAKMILVIVRYFTSVTAGEFK